MTKLRFAERRTLVRMLIAALVVAGGGMALGWNAGEMTPPPPGPIAHDPWSLDQPTQADVTKDVGVLATLHPWAGIVEAKKPQAPEQRRAPPSWRLAGVVQRGDEKLALIATGKPPRISFEYKRVGESLPDGSILVQITSDSAKTQKSSPSSAEAKSPSSETLASDSHTYQLFGKSH